MSGMQIFNAHPALYASDASNFSKPVLKIGAELQSDANEVGYVDIGAVRIRTTGILGYGPDGMGGQSERAFPAWATIPGPQDLADGRRWHILFAWILLLCGVIYAFWAFRLWPSRRDIRELPKTVRSHLVPWHLPVSATLNPLQKLSYFAIVFVVVPMIIVSGLALSPAVDAHAHWLPQLLGGRQFARIWHFAGMFVLIGFFAVHLLMVAVTGLWNNLRSMITGWYRVSETPAHPKASTAEPKLS